MEVVEYALGKLGSFLYHNYYLDFYDTAFGFAVSVGMVLAVFAVEIACIGYGQSSLRRVLVDRSKSTITDIVYFVLQTTGMIVLFAALSSLGLSYFIVEAVKAFPHLKLGANLPGWAQVLLFLVFADFVLYWLHRVMHWSPSLWRLHEFHHAAEEFNVLTSHREHPLEKAISMVVMVVPGLLLGFPTTQFAIVLFLFGGIGFVKHSAIPWHGWFGKYVIQSARDHSIHHSKLRKHHNSNFANYFPIWDHLFGTYYHGDDTQVELGSYRPYFNKTDPVSESIATQLRFVQRAGQSLGSLLQASRSARRSPMSGQDLKFLDIGHWVIVACGGYMGRRAQVVGRRRDTLRLLINGGPRDPVRVNVADVKPEIAQA